jgi:hypothetical protein
MRVNPEWKNDKAILPELNDLISRPTLPWSVPIDRNAVGRFSAVCWYFGKELNKRLRLPIGLVQVTYGATPVSHWMATEPYNKYLWLQPHQVVIAHITLHIAGA